MPDFSNINIETPLLLLKSISIKQSNELFKIYSNKEVQKYTDNELIDNVTDTKKLIISLIKKSKNKSNIFLGIFLQNNNKLIGTIRIYHIDFKHSFSSLGILLDKQYWRKGIMQETLNYFLDYYFNKLNFNRIEAQSFVENYPAIKLFEKLGFKNEGRLRKNFLIAGKFEDSFLFSMLKNEFK